MTPKLHTDTRIAYGAMCSWWDTIDKVGKTEPDRNGHSIPCCPRCRRVLMEVPSPESWWAGVDRYEIAHPGYRALIEWAQGKCFPSFKAAAAAYQAETGKVVSL
jgi:hypothetical protein